MTSRTLRHYDEIGLLRPSHVASNGYRHYGEAELLRLQQILLMRELGLGLAAIADVLNRDIDEVQALRAHHERLRAEQDRLAVLAETVARTIAELEAREGDTGMSEINRPENLFEGFDPERYEAEARERWPEQWEQSQRVAQKMTSAEQVQLQQQMTAQMARMAELMRAGAPVNDVAVLAEIDAHYRGICRFWTPNADAYRGLGQLYVGDPRFKANYEAIAAGLAEYQRDAMAAYADARLT